MAYSVETKASSPANVLREELDRAERQIVALDGANIADYLLLLDQIEARLNELSTEASDLRPEWGRWDSLTSRLQSKPDPLVAAAARAGGLGKLRQQHPPATGFWWHLDEEVARRRFQSIKRMVTTLVIVVVLVGGGWWAINTFFPPSADAVQMMNTNSQLEDLIAQQRWADALTIVEEARQTLPNEPELALWEVVFAEQLGDAKRAMTAWEQAKAMVPDKPVELLVQLGNQRLQVGNLLGAKAAGEQAMATDPKNPQATFLLGSVAETTDDISTAIDMFDRTFTLAEQDNPQLAVIARVRMGNLLQRAPAMSSSNEITPTMTLTGTTIISTTL